MLDEAIREYAMQAMEIVGVRSAKIGSDSKDKGYIVSRTSIRGLALCLIVSSILFLVVGFGLRHDIDLQRHAVADERAALGQNKRALFRTKELDMLDEAQQEAKLVKVLSVLQQHFARDRKEADMTRVFTAQVRNAMRAHKQSVDKILQGLEGNAVVVKYLRQTLHKAADEFHKQAHDITRQYGAAILNEGKAAEEKLDVLTLSVTKELAADVSEEKRDRAQMSKLVSSDKAFAKVAREFAAEGRPMSKDEQDVERVIRNFRDKVVSLPKLDIDPVTIRHAHKLWHDFETGQGAFAHNAGTSSGTQTLAETQMSKVLKEANMVPGPNVVAQFRDLVDRTTFKQVRAPLEAELHKWADGKLGDTEAMLDIEEQVQKGNVNAEWLHEGESLHTESEMMTLHTEDHDKHQGEGEDDVPCQARAYAFYPTLTTSSRASPPLTGEGVPAALRGSSAQTP